MAGEIFFKSGSKSSITTEAPLTPSYKAGTVYFAIDDDNNGFIYLDYDNKRIPMTSVAEKASNDSADHSIVDHYVHSITSAANTLTYKDGDGDQLGTASIINSVSNAWTNGTTAGPTIQTTVNGVSGSAVAIPSAGASASGVVTTGAQTFAGSKTFSSKIIGNLQGNADTATSATNDSSSHKIADWYVHSIAHSNNTLVYKDGDGDSLGSVAIPGAFFVKGTQTASTNAWTGALPSGVTQYYEGLSIAYFLPYAGTSSAATLNLGGLGAKPVILGENATGSTTTHYAAKNVIWMTYLTDSGVNSGNGYWKVSAHRNSTYYYTTAYCGTGAGTAAKTGSVSYYTLQPGYIPVMFIYDNTAQSALTLNINSTGAKPLYINGAASSSSNYTIKRGVYIVHYDGNNYYLRTDDVIPGTIERAIADGNGNEILTTYANSLTLSGNTLTLKNKNNDALSTVTIAASDTKVNVTLGTTSKAYLLATTSTPTATAAGVTSIADTGVYLGTTAGELVATKFTGDLAGNAATATLAAKATGDANGNPILTTYASSLSGSGTTLTLKNKNGDTLSTVTTQDTKNTAGSTNDTSKLYLVGAKSQATSAQTYSSSKVYVTDDTLTAPTFAGDLTGNAATATLAAKATGDANGNPILTTYANSLTLSGNTLTLKNKNGDNLSQVTIAASDTKVNVTLGTTSKAYILGTTTTPTATAAGVTSIADTGVYLGTTAGELVATKFTGDLAGNAATATLASKATGDANGNPILSTYAGSLEVSGRTLTLKAKNGDTLSTVTTQDNDTKNTAGSTNSTSKLYLIGATSQAANPQTYSSSKVYVTDGTVTATTFSGNLSGNATSATTATTATYDSGNNEIESTYIKSISYSGNSATNAAGTAITAGSAGLVTMLTGDDTPSKIDIPAATASIAGVVGNGSQTWAGTKTFSTGVTIASGTSTKAVFNYSDIQAGTSDAARPVWFAWAGQNGTPVIDSDFTYNPSSNTLKATNFDGLATKATGDGNGNEILTTYANSLTLSGNTLTLKNKNGDNLSQVTIAASDTKVNVTLGTTSKAYILGTTTTPTSTAAGVTSIADTGVYLGTTAGELVATKFTGDLNGNAATATLASKATGDGNGNEIISKYASSLSASGTTLTLKAKNGDTLSTVTTQDTKNTAGSSQKATKIYIIGAESQATSAQTYSSSKVYITDGTVTATTFSGALDGNAATATLATKATGDGSGNEIISKYASSLSASGTTLTLKAKNGDTLSTVTTQDTKNTAGSTDSTSKLFLIGATSQAANPQTYSSSKVYVTDGTVTATTFSGALSGNASTATLADKATGDGSGNEIISHYASELTVSGTTLTLKAKNGDTLSTVTTQDNDTKNTAGSTNDTSKLFIIGAKSQAANPQTYSSSKVYITDGTITATTFSGNATSATSATSATNDSSGHKIVDWYVHGISSSNNTLTLISGDEDNLTHNTATASIINSVSNTWADGTTSGPTIKTTVNGVAGTAVAIPSASKTASGVITTGSQSFKGRKGFGYISLYAYDDSANAVQWSGDFMYYSNAGTKVAETWYDIGNATNISSGKFYWRQWSPNSTADANVTSYYETYSLPTVATGLTENKSYSILTTKSTVTVAQGGTGATTFTSNAVLYGNGTSAIQAKASASGALYATATNGALSFGTLPVAQGGTGTTSFTANSVVISGSTTTAALTTRAITNNTSNTAIATGTNIPTMNTIYYGLAVINNASQNRGVSIYAPTSAGTANQILVSAGGTSAPTWKATANGAAYATSTNGALTFGTLPIAQGGTGLTSSPSMLTNLGSTTAANVLQASPRPGVTGTLPVGNGGTGMTTTTNVNAVVIGNSTTATNAMQTVATANGAFYATAANAKPQFGTLPIAQGGTGKSSWTANKLVYSSAATTLTNTSGLSYFSGNSTAATPATYTRLHINGTTYGNDAATMISGTAGLFTFGDGGPQITFDTNATPGGGQAGALIFTDHDNAATGASWHFVSNQSDWNVTSKRFHARTSISIGTDLPNTSAALYVKGTTLIDNENVINFKIPRKQASGGGWAFQPMRFIGNDNADFAHIGVLGNADTLTYIYIGSNAYDSTNNLRIYPDGTVRGAKIYGAVWNDYAEYRQTKEDIKPGRVVIETGNGDLKLSDRRLQPGANVTTDTFGFAIGETEINKTPIAVSGRVLVYPYESIDEFRKHIGGPVCSGPDGTVSIMSINEERMYPSRIIGTVSEIPDYETWGTENIQVNGRIWIRIR